MTSHRGPFHYQGHTLTDPIWEWGYVHQYYVQDHAKGKTYLGTDSHGEMKFVFFWLRLLTYLKLLE